MYNDLKVCLNDENLNQEPYVYKYPEHDPDEKEPVLKEVKDEKESKKVAKKVEEPKKKTSFSTIIIVFLVIVLLAGVGALLFILYPTFKGSDNVKIPDVSGLSVVEAEKVLTGEGFIVADETEKVVNDKYEAGIVVDTNPKIGRTRAKGTKITLVESIGKNETYKIENYVGQNYIKVQTMLETKYKMKVKIEKKDVELKENQDLDNIIEQSIKPDEEIIISEDNPKTIILYIPNAYYKYPDFVGEGWSVEAVQEFAENNEINLYISYVESSEYPVGTIIKQSREKDSKIVSGASFTITVTKKPTPKVEEPEEEEQNQDNQ